MKIYPAFIESYNQDRRTVRIRIDGMTGDNEFPEADLIFGIGDKFNHTEIHITKGDAVWVSFVNDDMRYPIVLGYRSPLSGNVNGWRKFHHENIGLESFQNTEIKAGGDITIIAGGSVTIKGNSLKMEFSDIEEHGNAVRNGTQKNISLASFLSGFDAGGNGRVVSHSGITTSDDVIAQGKSLASHTHGGDSGGTTTEPR